MSNVSIKDKNKIRISTGRKIFNVINILFMIFIVLVMFLPYLNVIAKAFNDGMDASRGGVLFWPRKFTLNNFNIIFSDTTVFNAALISVLRVIIACILTILVQFTCAYALTRQDLPGKSFILWLFMIPMFVSAGDVPTYVLYSKVGLINNFWVYILPTLFNLSNIVIIRTYMQSSIPFSIEESATLDGASEVKIFMQIILPLSMPILATIALWTIVGHWNSYTDTLLYIRDSKLYTLQYKMMKMIKEAEELKKIQLAAMQAGYVVDTNANSISTDTTISAQIVVTTLPIICTYPFFQKYFVTGITMGSVKG